MIPMIRVATWLAAMFLLPASAVAAPLMYVPTGGSNEVIVIDAAQDRITGRIGELENAHGLAATPDGRTLVAGSMQAAVQGDTALAAKPAQVSEEEHKQHHAPQVSPATTSSFLSIVDVEDARVIRRIPVAGLTHHTAVSPDGHVAVAVHSGAGMISLVDMETLAVFKTLKTGAAPNYAVFSKDGRRLYVSNSGAHTVSEIDTAQWRILRELPGGKKPEHLTLSGDGKTLYVAAVDGAEVSALDLGEGALKKTYSTGKGPHGLALSDDGRWLFASGLEDGTLVRWDLATGASHKVDLKPAPYHVEYVAAVKKLYVSSRIEPKIWVIEPRDMAVLGVIELGTGAVGHQMVVR